MEWIQRIEAYTINGHVLSKFQIVLSSVKQECAKRMRVLIRNSNDEQQYIDALKFMEELYKKHEKPAHEKQEAFK